MHTQYQFLVSKNDGISSISFHKYGRFKIMYFWGFLLLPSGPGDSNRLLKNVLTF
jgi:hypothetical protein